MSQAAQTVEFSLKPGAGFGVYRLIREIGEGGMGQVFLAEDTSLERRVALKFLTPQLAQKEEFRQRFVREARSAAKLNHTNIVTIYEVGEIGERVYIAMEFVEGRSLRELIDTRTLSSDQVLDTFIDMCKGLKKAHDAGIVHRDLKPSNIMVTPEKEVKILDFGLAKAISDGKLTGTGAALGTVNYMSPEQAKGTPTDQRSDLFSAGILLFELLTGVNPFVRGYVPATIHAIVYENVGELTSFQPDLAGQSHQAVIDKCLAKEPDQRYASVDDLLADLAKLKAGETIESVQVSRPEVGRNQTPTLAVLHLRNLGSDEDEFLTYGITEDLIVDLSRLGAVKVLPMRKVLKYKDSDLDTEELARRLGATMLLDGSLHRSSSSIRISAQLIDVASDDIIWSNRWEEDADKIGRVKSALAEGISSVLKIDSSVVRRADLGQSDSSNPEAYDFYLKGKYALEYRKKSADVDTAREHFKKALALEPNLLAARAGLAEIHIIAFELEEAQKLLTPALEDAQRRGLKGDEALVRTILGITANRATKLDESATQLRTAAKLYRELKDVSGEARALMELLKPLINATKVSEALELETRLGDLAQAGADAATVSQALFLTAAACQQDNDRLRAKSLYEDALQMARANDVKTVEWRVLKQMAGLYAFRGGKGLEAGMAYIEEARYIAEKLGDKFAIYNVDFTTLFMELSTGAFRMVLDKYADLLDRSRKMADYLAMASLEWGRGWALFFMGRYEDCIDQTARLKEAAARTPKKYALSSEAEALIQSAQAHFMLGRKSEALAMIPRAYALSDESQDDEKIIEIMTCGGEIRYYSGDRESAREDLRQVLEKDVSAGDGYCLAVSTGLLALMDLEDGKREEAFVELRKVVEQVAGHFAEVTARRLLGQALLDYGESDQDRANGRRTLMQALGIARKHENAVEITRINEILERAD